ncbi:sensor histidine kinase [Thermodesulfobacteriota bacterium]
MTSPYELTKRIISELRPGLLDDLGLEAAIEWQAQEFQRRTEIACKTDLILEGVDPDRDTSTAFFRIFQETVTNAVRHAKATEVTVRMRQEERALILTVSDNGVGITAEQVAGSESFGIIGMRERAHQLSGEFKIVGVEGKGTTVEVRIPIEQD